MHRFARRATTAAALVACALPCAGCMHDFDVFDPLPMTDTTSDASVVTLVDASAPGASSEGGNAPPVACDASADAGASAPPVDVGGDAGEPNGEGGTSSGGGDGGAVPVSKGCAIGGVTYGDEDVDPENICLWCDPSLSTAAWSDITDGAACGTDEACFGGICTSNFPDCMIDGTAYAPNTASPTNACLMCQPRQSESSWTSAPDGTSCPGGTCYAGACD